MDRYLSRVSNEDDISDALALVRSESWSAWSMTPSTEWFRPDEVPGAYEALVSVATEADAGHAYNRLMDALAHNHSGWVYAVAVPGAVHLARLTPLLPDLPQATALQVLADLLNFSVRDQVFIGPDGQQVQTHAAIQAAVTPLTPLLRSRRAASSGPVERGATALLEALADEK